jgi:hypothetical protein
MKILKRNQDRSIFFPETSCPQLPLAHNLPFPPFSTIFPWFHHSFFCALPLAPTKPLLLPQVFDLQVLPFSTCNNIFAYMLFVTLVFACWTQDYCEGLMLRSLKKNESGSHYSSMRNKVEHSIGPNNFQASHFLYQ